MPQPTTPRSPPSRTRAVAADEVVNPRDPVDSRKRITSLGTSGIRVIESLPDLGRAYAGLADCFIAPGFRLRHRHRLLLATRHNPMGMHVIVAVDGSYHVDGR